MKRFTSSVRRIWSRLWTCCRKRSDIGNAPKQRPSEAADENKQPEVEYQNNGHLEESKVDNTNLDDKKQVKQEVVEDESLQSLEKKETLVSPAQTVSIPVNTDLHHQNKPSAPIGSNNQEMHQTSQEVQALRRPLSGLKRTAHMMSALFGGDLAKQKIKQKLEREYQEIKDYMHQNDLPEHTQKQNLTGSNLQKDHMEVSHTHIDQTNDKQNESVSSVNPPAHDQIDQSIQDQVINQE